ncbi:MAG TPA: 2-oxoacid:acceptor oxidoreductase family protein, partial [Patescibacteria group bacterium]
MSFKSVTTVKIAGPAGAGIKSSGQLLSHILLNHGFHLHDYSEYPSLVRGGHNTYQVSFSAKPVSAAYRSVDIFFSLQPKHWQAHISEFTENTLVFADEATESSTDFGFNQIPFSQFASELKSSLYLNTACIGVVVYLLSLDKELSLNIIAKTFGSDSP